METEVQKVQKGILEIFKFLKTFFEKHNIRYVGCAGTVLGAVRHKDFIPWDDDMDLYLTREDYNRFLSLREEIRKEGYDLVSEDDKGYYLPFAKIIDTKTTLWEMKSYPFIMGHYYIDLFPLDGVDGTAAEVYRIQKQCKKYFFKYASPYAHFIPSDLIEAFRSRDSGMIKTIIWSWTMPKAVGDFYLKKFKQYVASHSSADSDKCVCMSQWEGRVFKKKWFEEVIEVPFADTTIIIPKAYDEYLTLAYGDYMTPPPVEERKTVHARYFVDLTQRLSLKEAKAVIRQKAKEKRV